MRRAIFGGSFDPIHYGHLLLAETAREACALDEIIFVPAGLPPHKRAVERASGEHRFAMIQAAIANCPEFSVSRFEIEASCVSYTILTVRHLRKLMPQDDLFLLVGSETLADIAQWYEAEELCRRVEIIAAHRAGFPQPDLTRLTALAGREKTAAWSKLVVPMPEMAVSSTLIRQRVRQGKSIRFLTPHAVELYIQEHGLYRD
ncbi:MAG: nicotinate-nucleotide adenylyltransferase [Planctomycetia bacterium]|nr:nicotinate-nucleotide adenylyltransferase [Planctomycetia bacterium]